MFQTSVRRHQLRIATLWVWGGMSAVAQLACCSEIRKMWCVKSGWSIVESTIDPKGERHTRWPPHGRWLCEVQHPCCFVIM